MMRLRQENRTDEVALCFHAKDKEKFCVRCKQRKRIARRVKREEQRARDKNRDSKARYAFIKQFGAVAFKHLQEKRQHQSYKHETDPDLVHYEQRRQYFAFAREKEASCLKRIEPIRKLTHAYFARLIGLRGKRVRREKGRKAA